MKPFAKRMLALASAAAITLTTLPAVCGTEVDATPAEIAESWTSMEAASVDALVPADARLRTASAATPLSREDLCGMVMNAYRSVTAITDEELGEPAGQFLDTTDPDVLHACTMGLVEPKLAGIFAPNDIVPRQDFFTTAAMLLEALGYPYNDDISVELSADADELMDYAIQPAQVMRFTGAIAEDAALEPNRPITAEEAVVILDGVMSFYSEWELDPVEPNRYLGEEVAEFALNYVGCRYVRGGQGPNKFDCSGFVYYVYKNFGYSLKPGARNQWSILDGTIKKADLLPGDLLFFSSNGRSGGIFHVGIYIGDGQFVHAANSRKGVIVTDIDHAWYANRYLGAKRAIN